jgi:hypothetical protein
MISLTLNLPLSLYPVFPVALPSTSKYTAAQARQARKISRA